MVNVRLARVLLLSAAVAAALGVLAACAPAAVTEPARPVVVVVAGPTERPLAVLGDAARDALREAGFPGSFGPRIISRIADYRDLSARQAVATTAELGRIGNADLALYFGVQQLERTVEDHPLGHRRKVAVELRLHAVLVDPDSGAALWATRDVLRRHVRLEPDLEPLPRLADDPGATELRDRAVRALAAEAQQRIALELP